MEKFIVLGSLNVKLTARQHGLSCVRIVVGSDRRAG
jgi:hypothetical protein